MSQEGGSSFKEDWEPLPHHPHHLHMRKEKDNKWQRDAKSSNLRQELLQVPRHSSLQRHNLATHLDVEDVIQETVELLIQQSLDFILKVGLSFFIMFTSIQTQDIGHEYLDGIEILMEADLSQRDSNSPVYKKAEKQKRVLKYIF